MPSQLSVQTQIRLVTNSFFSGSLKYRKLHQLFGILPLGLFLLLHFFTNSNALLGARAYNTALDDSQQIPYALFIEIIFIILPLVYHGIFGMLLATGLLSKTFKNHAHLYPRQWSRKFQQSTGIFLFFFILFHILNFRLGLIPGLNTIPISETVDSAFSIVSREFGYIWVFAFYILGIMVTVLHFTNGIWLFLGDWNIVRGHAKRLLGYGCILLGLVLLFVGINSAVAFVKPGGIFGETQDRPRVIDPIKF